MGLSEEELAFYDTLETNHSAVQVLGDQTPRTMARELMQTAPQHVTIDRQVRETPRVKLRTLVNGGACKYGYPRDKQERASPTGLEQEKVLSKE